MNKKSYQLSEVSYLSIQDMSIELLKAHDQSDIWVVPIMLISYICVPSSQAVL